MPDRSEHTTSAQPTEDGANADTESLSDIDAELGDLPIGLSDAAAPPPPVVQGARINVSPQNDPGFSPEVGQNRLRPFEAKAPSRHEDNWDRTPNVTGTGAIHCKTFHCKLTADSMQYLDEQINTWLDQHPQYEVKFVTTTTGDWGGKMGTETHMIVQVWV